MIYVVSDWNEMEPWTWIIQAFYMMVGSWYYMATRSDWAYTSVYGSLQERYYNKIAAERKFSFEKVEALEEYVKTIEEQLVFYLGPELLEEMQEAVKSDMADEQTDKS